MPSNPSKKTIIERARLLALRITRAANHFARLLVDLGKAKTMRALFLSVSAPASLVDRGKVKAIYALGLRKEPANLSIVVKYPSRSRPEIFKERLSQWIDMLSLRHEVRFVCSFDDDDESMRTESIMAFIDGQRKRAPIDVYYNPQPQSKIGAMSANLESYRADMLILCQDDMEILARGYDHLLARYLFYYFPDGDGVINVRLALNESGWKTLVASPVLGWKYYRRFNYIFNPVYPNLVGDVELKHVAEKLGKLAHVNDPKILNHEWYAIDDELRRRTELLSSHETAKALFKVRKGRGFDL